MVFEHWREMGNVKKKMHRRRNKSRVCIFHCGKVRRYKRHTFYIRETRGGLNMGHTMSVIEWKAIANQVSVRN